MVKINKLDLAYQSLGGLFMLNFFLTGLMVNVSELFDPRL